MTHCDLVLVRLELALANSLLQDVFSQTLLPDTYLVPLPDPHLLARRSITVALSLLL